MGQTICHPPQLLKKNNKLFALADDTSSENPQNLVVVGVKKKIGS